MKGTKLAIEWGKGLDAFGLQRFALLQYPYELGHHNFVFLGIKNKPSMSEQLIVYGFEVPLEQRLRIPNVAVVDWQFGFVASLCECSKTFPGVVGIDSIIRSMANLKFGDFIEVAIVVWGWWMRS